MCCPNANRYIPGAAACPWFRQQAGGFHSPASVSVSLGPDGRGEPISQFGAALYYLYAAPEEGRGVAARSGPADIEGGWLQYLCLR